jgi:hypothetical protein
MAAGLATAAPETATKVFTSAGEMREVLEELLAAVRRDPEVGGRIGSLHGSYRYIFDDVGLTLDVTPDGDGAFSWSFDAAAIPDPAVTLEMSSEVANRYLQGRENLAIALARRHVRYRGSSRAALGVVPINRELGSFYREVLEGSHRHLLLD